MPKQECINCGDVTNKLFTSGLCPDCYYLVSVPINNCVSDLSDEEIYELNNDKEGVTED